MKQENKEVWIEGTRFENQEELNKVYGVSLIIAGLLPIGYAYAYELVWGYLMGAVMIFFGFSLMNAKEVKNDTRN